MSDSRLRVARHQVATLTKVVVSQAEELVKLRLDRQVMRDKCKRMARAQGKWGENKRGLEGSVARLMDEQDRLVKERDAFRERLVAHGIKLPDLTPPGGS